MLSEGGNTKNVIRVHFNPGVHADVRDQAGMTRGHEAVVQQARIVSARVEPRGFAAERSREERVHDAQILGAAEGKHGKTHIIDAAQSVRPQGGAWLFCRRRANTGIEVTEMCANASGRVRHFL